VTARAWWFAALLLLSACALVPAPQTVTQSIVYAESTATTANLGAAALVRTGALSPDQAGRIGDTSAEVFAAVRVARSLAASHDDAGAAAWLASHDEALQQLVAFLNAHPGAGR
jgi:hypothetical protein